MTKRRTLERRRGLTIEPLAQRWPELIHLTEPDAWRRFAATDCCRPPRFSIVSRSRGRDATRSRRGVVAKTSVSAIPSTRHAWIHDNKPINTAALKRTLVDMSEMDWYRELNRRVIFWLTRQRLERLLNAKPNRGRPLAVLVIDTRLLVETYAERVELAHINTGAVRHTANLARGVAPFSASATTPLRIGAGSRHASRLSKSPCPTRSQTSNASLSTSTALNSVHVVEAAKQIHA